MPLRCLMGLPMAVPSWALQSVAVRSPPAVTTVVPSGLNAETTSPPGWVMGLPRGEPSAFQSLAEPVPEVRRTVPSGLKVTAPTASPCSITGPAREPSATFQRRAVAFWQPVRTSVPSGLNAAASTGCPW
jgi:hypothetical protein